MKTNIKNYFLALVLLLAGSAAVQAQIAIGSSDKPHPAAILDLKSAATKGLLLPNVALDNDNLETFILDGADNKEAAKGLLVFNTIDNQVYFWNGTKWNRLSGAGADPGEETPEIKTVECEGLIFMDRNLGASDSANPNPADYDAGDNTSPDGDLNGGYYQWGRMADGHEQWNSEVVEALSPPEFEEDAGGQIHAHCRAYGKFIKGTNDNRFDWRVTPYDDLWNGSNEVDGGGFGNPCPEGFRVPTADEWNTIMTYLTWNEAAKGMSGCSKLFLPAAGNRNHDNGSFSYVGYAANYWSSTIDGEEAKSLAFSAYGKSIGVYARAIGMPVRCIKK